MDLAQSTRLGLTSMLVFQTIQAHAPSGIPVTFCKPLLVFGQRIGLESQNICHDGGFFHAHLEVYGQQGINHPLPHL